MDDHGCDCRNSKAPLPRDLRHTLCTSWVRDAVCHSPSEEWLPPVFSRCGPGRKQLTILSKWSVWAPTV